MYLKSLQMLGFKSFVEKTTLEFLPGVGAIVGPNGCGKSNVSDAIRWVLGEQSAKALRGGEMVDVIFNGTDKRKPLGMAEVSLTIGDCEQTLGLGYNEVTITRRVFRDGKGEYLLNKIPCRLRDIQQTFMDTGIGRASYWLMEQGKMDKILSSRPEDRRVIFEEAAGITKYKAQKNEALNKLDLTTRNLEQVDPLLREIKRQITSLQRQAGKARRYKELTAELKIAETKLGRHQYDTLLIEIANFQSQVDALAAQLQESARAIEADETAVRESRVAEQAAERSVSEVERRQLEITNEIRRCEDRIRISQNRISELAADRDHRAAGLNGADEKIRAHQQLVAQAEESCRAREAERVLADAGFQEQQALLQQAEAGVQAASLTVQEANAVVQTADRKISEIKNLVINTEQKIAQLRNHRAQLEQRRQADARRAERLAAERQIQEERLRKLEGRAKTNHDELTLLQVVAEKARLAFVDAENVVAKALAGARHGGANLNSALDAVIESLQQAGDARVTWFEAEISWAEKRGETSSLQGEQKDTKGRLETATWELKELTEQRKGEEQIADIEKLLVDLAQSEVQVRDQVRAAQSERDQRAGERDERVAERDLRNAERNAQQERLGQAKIGVLSAQNACFSASERKESAAARVTELQEQVTRWQAEIGRDAERGVALDREIAAARTAIAEAQERGQGLEGELLEKRSERTAATQITFAKENALRQKRGSLGDFQQQRSQLEVKLAEKNKDVENLVHQLLQRHQVDVTTVPTAAAGAQEANEPNEANEDWVVLQDKVDELRIRVEEMGPVNTEAIQEYDELETRHKEITQQQQDLVSARDNLKEAIAKINATAKQMFQETFDKINTNFQEMFTELFGGGRASLTLMEIPEGGDDVLERGVEIMARPPGKQLQTVGLLSGGEKAMTAIALIFAIYMVKPAPFCVFDELDAPLDESNVGRFCKVVQRFVSQSQFIMITHNKRSMSMADVLYGVTMQESGVSNLVSVKFSKPDDSKYEEPKAAGSSQSDSVNPADATKASTQKPISSEPAESPAVESPAAEVATEATAAVSSAS